MGVYGRKNYVSLPKYKSVFYTAAVPQPKKFIYTAAVHKV